MNAAVLSLLLVVVQDAGSKPAVFVNDEAVPAAVVSMNADPTRFAPGDLLRVAGHVLAPPAEKELRFRTTPREDGRLLLQVEGKLDRIVGAIVSSRMGEKESILHNPLATMSAEEIRGLWGLRIDAWTDAIAEKTALIDPARTCVTLNDGAFRNPGKKMPPLPAGLRALRINASASGGYCDTSELRNYKELRYFSLEGMGGPFDASVVAETRSLRVLNLSRQEVGNIRALSGLGELRFLDLGWVEKLDDISFQIEAPERRFSGSVAHLYCSPAVARASWRGLLS